MLYFLWIVPLLMGLVIALLGGVGILALRKRDSVSEAVAMGSDMIDSMWVGYELYGHRNKLKAQYKKSTNKALTWLCGGLGIVVISAIGLLHPLLALVAGCFVLLIPTAVVYVHEHVNGHQIRASLCVMITILCWSGLTLGIGRLMTGTTLLDVTKISLLLLALFMAWLGKFLLDKALATALAK